MTYRERYKQLHPEEAVATIHVPFCPNALMPDMLAFRCPCISTPSSLFACRSCWDSEIPNDKEAGT